MGRFAIVTERQLVLTNAFAGREIRDGVQVSTILPGLLMTDRRRTMPQGHVEAHGLPEGVAKAIAFLFVLDRRWTTGTAFVDGGETMST